MSFFEGMQAARTQRVLNVLCEAPFFYVEDDPELFGYVRRHRVELARFFVEAFDWQLVVDDGVAHVHKARWHNDAITKKQRGTFEPTRPGECIALVVLLDLYERMRAERGPQTECAANAEPTPSCRPASPALRPGPRPRVSMGALLQHASQRLAELGLADRFDESALRELYRDLVPTLMRHRLVRELAEHDGTRTYELLPGLGLYDPRALTDEAIREAFEGGRTR